MESSGLFYSSISFHLIPSHSISLFQKVPQPSIFAYYFLHLSLRFYDVPWVCSGMFYNLLQHSVTFHQVPSCSMVFVPEHSGSFHHFPGCSTIFYHVPWVCSGTFRVIPGCSTMFRAVPPFSIVFHGVPLGSGTSCIFSMTFREVLVVIFFCI